MTAVKDKHMLSLRCNSLSHNSRQKKKAKVLTLVPDSCLNWGAIKDYHGDYHVHCWEEVLFRVSNWPEMSFKLISKLRTHFLLPL